MTVYYADDQVTLYHGDALEILRMMPSGSVNCCVTSPPYYGLRDYGEPGQYGLEPSPAEYVETMRAVFAQVRRVLADDGTCWLNLGSSYLNGSPGGTQGKTGQRASRTFTATGVGAGVAARRGAQTNGSLCTTPQGSTGPGYAYSDLCDGCAVALSTRTVHSIQPRHEAVSPDGRTDRDSGPSGSGSASPDASLHGAPESTSSRCPEPHPDGCSHCGNCGACLAVLRSSSRDARLCVRTEGYSDGIASPGSVGRSRGMDALGTAWLNYTSRLGPKSLIPVPWMVAMSLQDDGWILRNAIVWDKPNPMPESITDRLSTTYETVFLLAKSRRYWFDLDPIREPLDHPDALDGTRVFGGKAKDSGAGRVGASARRAGLYRSIYGATGMPEQTNMGPTGSRHTHNSVKGRNPGDVWTMPTQKFAEAHFAVMPPALAERCILAGCKPGGVVLDPFTGSGTTGMVALRHGRRFVGIDLSASYLDLALRTRLAQTAILDEVAS